MSGIFSMASHAMQQYLPDVVIQKQIGCAHFWALSVAISILLVANSSPVFSHWNVSFRDPVFLYKKEHRGAGRVSLIVQISNGTCVILYAQRSLFHQRNPQSQCKSGRAKDDQARK